MLKHDSLGKIDKCDVQIQYVSFILSREWQGKLTTFFREASVLGSLLLLFFSNSVQTYNSQKLAVEGNVSKSVCVRVYIYWLGSDTVMSYFLRLASSDFCAVFHKNAAQTQFIVHWWRLVARMTLYICFSRKQTELKVIRSEVCHRWCPWATGLSDNSITANFLIEDKSLKKQLTKQKRASIFVYANSFEAYYWWPSWFV